MKRNEKGVVREDRGPRGLVRALVAIQLAIAIGLAARPVESRGQRLNDSSDASIRLIVRADDMGAAHGMNEACIKSCTDGVARSVEVIVPGPWFMEAVQLLRENPGIDAGVHLDLTSEWDLVKWGPVAKDVPSLTDKLGNFYPTTRQRQGYPPNTGFLECGWQLDEVERELRAQIETALAFLPNVSHLSAHMATATSTPELRRLVDRLAEEYALPIDIDGLRRVRDLGGANAAEMEASLVSILESLEPGLWLIVEHPGFDTPEMRAIGHIGSRNVAAFRAAVTHAFTSTKVKDVIRRRGIRLVSYGDVIGNRAAKSEGG